MSNKHIPSLVPRQGFTADHLRSLLSYDACTGVFHWAAQIGTQPKVGKVAGHLGKDGYVRIGLYGRGYAANQLAWLYVTGEWSDKKVDHRNRCRSDNRFCNLRQATDAQNSANSKLQRNNTSGVKGVCWNKQKGRWGIKIVSLFDSFEEAVEARRRLSEIIYGEFVNHGEEERRS